MTMELLNGRMKLALGIWNGLIGGHDNQVMMAVKKIAEVMIVGKGALHYGEETQMERISNGMMFHAPIVIGLFVNIQIS